MSVIYEPRGRAREYSELACNLYRGCTHGCIYCYAPACMHTTDSKWHGISEPRPNILKNLEKDAANLTGDRRRILFCFLSDPYQPIEREQRLTRQALQIMERFKLKSQVLTKGSAELISEDLDLMKRSRTHLGITISFVDDKMRTKWEPKASSIQSRLDILKEAHEMGIYTWVSLEPVIDPDQALEVVRTTHKYVNFWKIGKLNHMKDHEKSIDWAQFLVDVERLLSKLKSKYYIKHDLRLFKKN